MKSLLCFVLAALMLPVILVLCLLTCMTVAAKAVADLLNWLRLKLSCIVHLIAAWGESL